METNILLIAIIGSLVLSYLTMINKIGKIIMIRYSKFKDEILEESDIIKGELMTAAIMFILIAESVFINLYWMGSFEKGAIFITILLTVVFYVIFDLLTGKLSKNIEYEINFSKMKLFKYNRMMIIVLAVVTNVIVVINIIS